MKKNIIVMLIVALSLAIAMAGTAVASSIVDSPKVSVTLLSQDPDPAQPGKYVELRWKVENYGGKETDNFIFKIEPEFPFSLDPGVSDEQRLDKLDSYQIGEDAYIVYFRLRISPDAVIGTNKIKYKYSINNGVSWLETKDDVRIDESTVPIRIKSVSTNPTTVSPGGKFKIIFSVENIGPKIIKNLQASLGFTYNSETLPFSPDDDVNEKVVKSLSPGESTFFEFNLLADSDASIESYKVPLSINFYDEDGNSYSKSYNIGVSVYDKPEYLINLESSDIYKNNQKGKIVLSISNKGISKIKFLSLEILPSNDYDIISQNMVYIGNLDSDDFETTEFEIYTHSDKKSVPIQFKVNFKDEYNKGYDNNEIVYLKLYDKDEIIKYGFEKGEKKSNYIFLVLIGIPLIIFWIFMLIDAFKSDMELYRKLLWVILILTTLIVGAILYYLIGRKRGA